MKKMSIAAVFTASSVLMSISALAGSYPNPARFEKAVKAFEKSDASEFPPAGAVLCIGSSSMRKWHSHIKEDLAPLTVIPRGFGGSNMNDLLYFTDRIVIPYKPRAILVYEGDNDSAAGVSKELFKQTLESFIKKVHTALPEVRIYLISVKPSESRIKLKPLMQKYNAIMKKAAESNPLISYIDVFNPMLDESGKPLPHIFLKDKLHMNRDGYMIWKKAIHPILVEKEKKYEH